MIQELKFHEISSVDGANGFVDGVLEFGQQVVDAAHDSGKKIGKAVTSLFYL